MKISIVLEALTGTFVTDTDRASKQFQRRMKEMERTAKQAGALIGTALAAGATAAGVALKAAIDNADALDEMAQRTGIAIEQLSRLQIAAKLGAVDMESLQKAVGRLAVQQQNYAEGNKQAVALFDALGVKAEDSSGKLRDANDVLRDLADVFARLPDGANKTALAIDLFGKAGQNLIPFLNKGSTEIARIDALADRLGVTISRNTGQAASDFNDTLDLLGFGVKGLAAQVAADLLPDLQRLAEEFLQNTTEGEKVSETAHRIAEGIRMAASAAAAAVDSVQYLTSTMIGLYNVTKALSGLNPGYVLAKFAGGENPWKEDNLGNAGAAFDMAGQEAREFESRFGGGGSAAPPRRAGSRARGGRGMGAQSQEAALAAYIAAQEAARAAQDKGAGSSKAEAEARRTAAEAAKEQADRLQDLREALEKVRVAGEEFATQLEDLAAAGDPLEEAQLEYNRSLADLQKLAAEGEVSTTKLAQAEALLAAQHEKNTQAIRDRLDTGGQQLKQMQQELDLLNLQSQAERDRAQFLIDHPTATGDQADAAASMAAQIDETRKAIAAADEVRAHFEDAFVGVFEDGIDSVEEFGDALVKMLIRIAAQQASLKLFGEPGTTGGGLLGGIFGALFGGGGGGAGGGANAFAAAASGGWSVPGFAGGTDYHRGGMAWVGEEGPELVNLPRGSQVIPAPQSRRMAGGDTYIFNDTYRAPTDARTREQIAKDKAREIRTSTARNGA